MYDDGCWADCSVHRATAVDMPRAEFSTAGRVEVNDDDS